MAHHSIKAYLYNNALTGNPNDFVARVSSEHSLNVDEICESAVARGGADISAAAMEHAVNLWLREMTYCLCDGFSINTGWFTASAHIKGVFNSPLEHFDPARHTLMFELLQGSLLRKALETTSVEILGAAGAAMHVAQATDIMTGSVNDRLTPGRNLRITGSKIRIAGENSDTGIYFVNRSTQECTRVPDFDLVINLPSELLIMTPALAAGTYQLTIVTQYGGNSRQTLKEPRSATLDTVLTVS